MIPVIRTPRRLVPLSTNQMARCRIQMMLEVVVPSFPNGAVFFPAQLMRTITSQVRKTVDSQIVSVSSGDVATVQFSVTASALGAASE